MNPREPDTEHDRIEWLKTQARVERLQFRADCETAWTAHQEHANASILWRLGKWYVQRKLGFSSGSSGIGGVLSSFFNVGTGQQAGSNPSGFGKRMSTMGGFAAVVAMLWRNRNAISQVKRGAGVLGWCAKQCLKRKKLMLPVVIVLAGVGLFAWYRNKNNG